MKHIKDEEEFLDECYMFSGELADFVDSISGDNMWWFKECWYNNHDEGNYSVIYTSYITPEYRDFVLSIAVTKVNGSYQFKVLKQLTELA